MSRHWHRFARILPFVAAGSLFPGCLFAVSEVTGVTRPFREAVLSSSAPGEIEEILVREGQWVAAGDELIRLQREQEILEVERRKLLWENLAEMEAAEARLATIASELNSTRAVFEATRSVSKEELERKELEHALAQAELMQARMNKERERIEYEMAREALRRRVITSPMDGVVTRVWIEEGEGCELREPLLTVVDPRKVIFTANLEVFQLAMLDPADPAILRIESEGNENLMVSGEVVFLAPVLDRASGLGEIKVLVDNPDQTIRPGVAATLVLGTKMLEP